MKIYTSSTVLILVFILIQACTQTQVPKEHKLIVNLKNAPFDSLFLHDYTRGKTHVITGKKTDKFVWEFIVPDSIVENYLFMKLSVSAYDPTTNSSRTVRFISSTSGKETNLVNVGVEDRLSHIYGAYIKKTTFPNEGILDLDGSQYVGDMIHEDFQLIVKDKQSDIAVRAKDPLFSWFMDNEKTYDELLKSYVALAKQHPDSRFLMTYLSDNLKLYRSKEDLKKVYDELSEKHKNTHWATEIKRHLNTNQFPNESLPRVDKNTEEDIIQNASKHNLIIFSASWCLPCIEEIPLLKKVNNDLGTDLIFTYISMDQESRITAFQDILNEHQIPWRTLYAYKDLKRITEKYFAKTIPHNILVYPDGKMEFIDVRDQADREDLYALLDN